MADVKGDFSGMSQAGGGNPKVTARVALLDLKDLRAMSQQSAEEEKGFDWGCVLGGGKKTTQQRCQYIDSRASLRISVGIDSNITGLSSYVYH